MDLNTSELKDRYFNSLVSSVNSCDLCKRMDCRKKVLSKFNGSINSKVLFIAEAPGRLGAECTGIPLYGDRTGDTFEMLLNNIGWKREDIFITNAILCNPQDENGNNSTPLKEEILNCSYFLSMTIELINPDVIVTLGVKALEAIKNIAPHNYILKDDVAKLLDWNGKKLFPLYHMGPRALIHRALPKQRGDFITLSHKVDLVHGIKKAQKSQQKKIEDNVLLETIKLILNKLESVSFFKLMKLLYLIDYNYYLENQHTLTNAVYLRMQEGPWIPTLKQIIISAEEQWCTSVLIQKKYYVRLKYEVDANLDEWDREFITKIVEKYRSYDDKKIKECVYLTAPMKFVLKQEKQGRQMNKTPILYKDSVIDRINN